MPEIKKCPFCENDGHYGFCDISGTPSTVNEDARRYFVSCLDCNARGPLADTKEEAIEKWNSVSEICFQKECTHFDSDRDFLNKMRLKDLLK